MKIHASSNNAWLLIATPGMLHLFAGSAACLDVGEATDVLWKWESTYI